MAVSSQLQKSVPIVGEELVDGVEIQPQTEIAFAQSSSQPESLPVENNEVPHANQPSLVHRLDPGPGQQQEQHQQQNTLPSTIEPEIVHLVTTLVGQGFADASHQQQYEVATSSNDAHQVPIQPQEMEANTTDMSYDSFCDEQRSSDKSALSDAISGKGRTRKLYPMKLKLEVVEYAKTHSKQATARHFKIHRRMVQRWCSEEDELLMYKNSDITRKPGAGMRPMYEKIDQKLADFFKFCIDNGIHVTSHMLKTKALELHKMEEGGSSDFKASGGWLRGFMRRNGISFKEQSINPTLIMTEKEESGILETSDDQGGHVLYGSESEPVADSNNTITTNENEVLLPTEVMTMENVQFTTEVADSEIPTEFTAAGMRQVAGELTTTNSLSLLLKRDCDDQDSTAFDEIVLPERTHHCLLQSIAVRYGTTAFGELLKQKQRRDGSLIWVRISTDEDIQRLQDDDVIYIRDLRREQE